jgi:hypothetical protein
VSSVSDSASVYSVDVAVQRVLAAGGSVDAAPFEIQIGRCVVVRDRWETALVPLDKSKGLLLTDEEAMKQWFAPCSAVPALSAARVRPGIARQRACIGCSEREGNVAVQAPATDQRELDVEVCRRAHVGDDGGSTFGAGAVPMRRANDIGVRGAKLLGDTVEAADHGGAAVGVKGERASVIVRAPAA